LHEINSCVSPVSKFAARLSVLCGLVFSFRGSTVVNAGTVRGVVSDKSGAIVPGAVAVLSSRGTGQQQARTTNGAGIFLFPSQPVGPYTLEVSAAGFGKTIVEGVYVQVGQPTTVDVELQPGTRSESITVSGESPLLRAEDSNQSSVVNRELLEGLPLNGRKILKKSSKIAPYGRTTSFLLYNQKLAAVAFH